MDTNKIEVYWNLIPREQNQDKDANSFGFRVKCRDYDMTFTGIELNKGQIREWDAFRYIAYVCDFHREETSKAINTQNMSRFVFSPDMQTHEKEESDYEFSQEFKDKESDYSKRK